MSVLGRARKRTLRNVYGVGSPTYGVVVVDCGLTSHSAIFQLYSDGTDVQFPNFDLLSGTHAMGG